MKRSPIILITPSSEQKGAEFEDPSVSLSNRYADAIIASGGLPQIFPATTVRTVVAEAVQRCDGVMVTGGDDIDPKLYVKNLPGELAKTVGPLDLRRDIWEREVISEVFAQRKPLLGICRGHQMINVALGGTLIVDVPQQVPNSLNHSNMVKKNEPAHDIKVEADSMLARMMGQQSFAVNSTHHQALGEVASELRVVARSSDGVIEAVEWKEVGPRAFLLGVQFHPERLIDRYEMFGQIFSGFVEACARQREKKL
jgi:putative glutamine amidotransferase